MEMAMFDAVYSVCAELGLADDVGSVECERVRGEWVEAGYPYPIHEFIIESASGSWSLVTTEEISAN